MASDEGAGIGRPASSADGSTSACLAPRSGLYFRPDGYVASCCAGWQVLGRVTGPNRRSLRDIWEGRAAQELRTALDAGDFGLGCWECGNAATAGLRSSSLATEFDRYAESTTSEHPRLIDFALSNRCNLQCVMCNGGLSSAIRAQREHRPPLPAAYDDQFFEELDEFLPHLERAQFKGGEPFLANENRRIWDSFLRLGGSREVTVTTNGTIWNDRVERYVRDLAMEVILSVDAVDGPTLERIRVGTHANEVWRNVERFAAATAATGRNLTLCMCLMSSNWAELRPFLVEVDRRGLQPSVIWVDGPAHFNLLGLPVAQLRAVERGWEAEAAGPELSPRAAAIWRSAQARIRDTIESAAGSAVEVRVPIGATSRPASPAVDRYRKELADISQGDLLELELVNEIVRSVSGPSLFKWLDPDQWLGVGLDQFITVLSGTAGTTMRYEVQSGEQGVHRSMVIIGSEPDVMRVRFWYVPADGIGSRRSHILMGLVPPSVPGARAGDAGAASVGPRT